MRNTIWILSLALLVHSAYGHGLTVSSIEEVHGKVDIIFAAKVTKVSKPKKEYTGEESYPIEIEFELIENLKGTLTTKTIYGAPTTKTRAIYTQPAIERKLPDGTAERVWLKVLASGKELSVVKDEEYLIYAHKDAVQDGDPVVRIVRIDPVSEKQKLTELLKEGKGKSQQLDGEATSKPTPDGVASEASHP